MQFESGGELFKNFGLAVASQKLNCTVTKQEAVEFAGGVPPKALPSQAGAQS